MQTGLWFTMHTSVGEYGGFESLNSMAFDVCASVLVVTGGIERGSPPSTSSCTAVSTWETSQLLLVDFLEGDFGEREGEVVGPGGGVTSLTVGLVGRERWWWLYAAPSKSTFCCWSPQTRASSWRRISCVLGSDSQYKNNSSTFFLASGAITSTAILLLTEASIPVFFHGTIYLLVLYQCRDLKVYSSMRKEFPFI